MIEPKIDDLLASVDSKYSLVILAAKRAREINSYYSQLGEGRGEFVPPLGRDRRPDQQAAVDRPRRDRRGEDRLRANRGARGRVAPALRTPGVARRHRWHRRVQGGIARPTPGRAGADVRVVLTRVRRRGSSAPDTFAALTGKPVHTSLWDEPGEVAARAIWRTTPTSRSSRPPPRTSLAKLANGLADDLLTVDPARSDVPAGRSRPRCTPACGSTPRRPRTSRRSSSAASGSSVRSRARSPRGDEGIGPAWRSPRRSCTAIEAPLARARDLAGARIVVTAGPTHEPIDPVRFIGNRSSGKMGVAVAAEARARGADVRAGPRSRHGAAAARRRRRARSTTAEEMRERSCARSDGADAVVMAAAVADFRPKAVAEGKLKKEAGHPELHLEPTPDILARARRAQAAAAVLVGFAAETSDLEAAGRKKLRPKHLDLVVVNEVGREGTGFGSDTNVAMILSADGRGRTAAHVDQGRAGHRDLRPRRRRSSPEPGGSSP